MLKVRSRATVPADDPFPSDWHGKLRSNVLASATPPSASVSSLYYGPADGKMTKAREPASQGPRVERKGTAQSRRIFTNSTGPASVIRMYPVPVRKPPRDHPSGTLYTEACRVASP